MRSSSILSLLLLTQALACAADLTTRDGKVYHGYKILSHDAGFVTIMYSDGGGKIPLSQLPADLQQKYGYNKAQADAYVQSSTDQERQDRHALALEQQQHQAALARAAVPADPTGAEAPSAPTPSANPNPPPPPASAPAAPTGLSPSDVAAINAKITDLQRDISSLRTEEEKENDPRTTSLDSVTTASTYDSRIQNDQDQIDKLHAELGGGQTAASTTPAEDVAEIRQKMDILTDEINFYERTQSNPKKFTHGAYGSKIIADQDELRKLAQELQDAEKRK